MRLPVRPPRDLLRRVDESTGALWLAAFAPLLGLYLATLRTNPFDMSADPVAVVPSAIGVAQHGTPVVTTSFWPSWSPWSVAVGSAHLVSNRTPGLVYLAAPFYWLTGTTNVRDQAPASLAAALCAAAAMATLALVLARFVTQRRALIAALIMGTATTTWAVGGTALYPHGPDQLLLALAMLALATERYAAAGLAFAAALLVRPTLGVVAVVTGLAAAWRQRSIRPAAALGAVTACGLVAYLAYAAHYWGAAGSGDAVQTATHAYGPHLLDLGPAAWWDLGYKLTGALVSPGRGVLVGSPFLLALLPGIRAAWRVAPSWVRSSAVGAVAYLLVQLKGEVFTGGSYFWSYRYPLETLTLCAPLLVLAWRDWTVKSQRRRAAFGALVLFSVAFQAIGAICFRGPYPDRPWSLADLTEAVTGDRGLLALVLLGGGVVAATAYYLRNRGSDRADVDDVAGADEPVAAGVAHD